MTPPKLHNEEEPTKLQEETSLPSQVARGVVIEELLDKVTSQECPQDTKVVLEEKKPMEA